MFPTKAGEFATAPRQESTVVPHPFRAARRAARARRRPQTGAERSRRFGLLFAKPLQAGNRQGGLTDKTRSLLNVRLYQIVRDRRWRQRFTSSICRKSRPGKSAAGQSRHFGPASLTSGLARIADILRNDRHVRILVFGRGFPNCDRPSCGALGRGLSLVRSWRAVVCFSVFRPPSRRRRRRNWARLHITGMGTSYVLLLIAFYVDNGEQLPVWKDLPHFTYWLLPLAVGIPLIVRALLWHPLARQTSSP